MIPSRGERTTIPTIETSRLIARPAAKSRRDFLKSPEKIKLLGVTASMASLPVSRS